MSDMFGISYSFVPFRDEILIALCRRDSPDAIEFVPYRHRQAGSPYLRVTPDDKVINKLYRPCRGRINRRRSDYHLSLSGTDHTFIVVVGILPTLLNLSLSGTGNFNSLVRRDFPDAVKFMRFRHPGRDLQLHLAGNLTM
jgi:hypothetical protein